MIHGVGIDLIEVSRFKEFDPASQEPFSSGELSYCFSKRYPARHLAARFAAKEAFFKALGSGALTPGEFNQVEVISGPTGSPELNVTGDVKDRLELRGISQIHLSLTHTDSTAAAVVILSVEPGQKAP